MHGAVARSAFRRNTPQCPSTFVRRMVQKAHAVVARNTFGNQNADTTTTTTTTTTTVGRPVTARGQGTKSPWHGGVQCLFPHACCCFATRSTATLDLCPNQTCGVDHGTMACSVLYIIYISYVSEISYISKTT